MNSGYHNRSNKYKKNNGPSNYDSKNKSNSEFANKYKNKDWKNSSEKKKIKCYKCGKLGHKKFECRVRIQRSNLADEASGEGSESDSKSEQSNIVQVIESSCAAMNSRPTLMNVSGLIKDCKIQCCIDTGASASFISKEVAIQKGFKINPSNTKVRLADGTISPVAGVTDRLPITIKSKTVQMQMLVLDNKSHSILLGQDWLDLTKAMLWPHENKIYFPDKLSSTIVKENDFELFSDEEPEDVQVLDHFK